MKNMSQDKSESSRITIKIIFVILISLLVSVFVINSGDKNQLDLTIGDMKVEKEQFIQIMNQQKNEVIHHFTVNYNAQIDDNFWEANFEGEVPYKVLYEKTVNELRLIESEYSLGKELNYVDEIDYTHFLTRMDQENFIRAEKVKNGEAVYGLKEYTKDLYLIYERDIFEKNYTSDKENEMMNISDDEIDVFFNEHKEIMFAKNDSIEFNYIQIYYALLELDEEAVTEHKNELIKVHQEMMASNKSLEEVVKNNDLLSPYFGYENIDSSELSSQGKYIGDIIEIALDFDGGQTSSVIDQNGSLFLVEVLDHTYYEHLDKKEVEASIIKMLREEKYDELIMNRMLERSLSGDEDKNQEFVLSLLK